MTIYTERNEVPSHLYTFSELYGLRIIDTDPTTYKKHFENNKYYKDSNGMSAGLLNIYKVKLHKLLTFSRLWGSYHTIMQYWRK